MAFKWAPPTVEAEKKSLEKSAEMPVSSERKLPAKLSSIFGGLAESLAPDPTPPVKWPISRSPRDFGGGGGAVGLGIVAALIASPGGGAAAAPPRSDPIVIAAARPAAKTEKPAPIEEDDDEEDAGMSESYTCVTSLVGGRPVSKLVYLHGGTDGGGGNRVTRVPLEPVSSVRLALSAPVVAEFLSHCDLCGKKLNGLDIFMYKGDKAFCSVECRWQQILSDELIEQCGPGAMKGFDLSASPCSAPLLFAPGVAAA